MDSIDWESLQKAEAEVRADFEEILSSAGRLAAKQLSGDMEQHADTVSGALDLHNPLVQNWIKEHTGELITNITDDSREAVRGIIKKAFDEGLHPKQSAKLIRDVVGLTDRQSNAVINYRNQLLGDGLAEGAAASKAERYATKLLKYRSEMIARTECLPGDAIVDAAVVRTAFRRWYVGDLIEIETRDGRKFSATPNHPMFTSRGWLSSGKISVGDYLVCDAFEQNSCSSGNKNVQRAPAKISEIFDSIKAVGVFERRTCSNPDFHGDGREGYVEVARPYRELTFGNFTPLSKPLVQSVLTPADFSRTAFCSRCHALLSVDQQPCPCDSSSSYVAVAKTSLNRVIRNAVNNLKLVYGSSVDVLLGNFFRRQVVPEVGGLSSSVNELFSGIRKSSLDSGLGQDITDPSRIGVHFYGNQIPAQSREVELDCVVSVRLRSFSGHVFNLSTRFGYFTINRGLYTGNTLTASNRGQYFLWQQAADKGLINPKTTRRVWIATAGACPICEALDGQTIGFAEHFSSEKTDDVGATVVTTTLTPPIHPSCRCSQGLLLETPVSKTEPVIIAPTDIVLPPIEELPTVPTAQEMRSTLSELVTQYEYKVAELQREYEALISDCGTLSNKAWEAKELGDNVEYHRLIGSALSKAEKAEKLQLKLSKIASKSVDVMHTAMYAETPSTVKIKLSTDFTENVPYPFTSQLEKTKEQLAKFKAIVGSGPNKLDGIDILVDHTNDSRSFAQRNAVFMAPQASPGTLFHELGHVIEHQPGIYEKMEAFLNARNSNGPLVKLSDLYPDSRYDPSEVTVIDNWGRLKDLLVHPEYTGKIYFYHATEILSRGMEALFLNPAKFAKLDPEYFDLIYNVLRGL